MNSLKAPMNLQKRKKTNPATNTWKTMRKQALLYGSNIKGMSSFHLLGFFVLIGVVLRDELGLFIRDVLLPLYFDRPTLWLREMVWVRACLSRPQT